MHNTELHFSPEAKSVWSTLTSEEKQSIMSYLSTHITQNKVRPRSALFRALGAQEPPEQIEIQNQTYQLLEIYKHDSWAATAIYQGKSDKVVCKFNRQQPIFGIPMDWLGRKLAQRENRFLQLFKDVPNIPDCCGDVFHNGQLLSYASAHIYVEGTPLRRYPGKVSDDFFPELQHLLRLIHSQNISYMDLNKRENILVTQDGKPCLIDFQICFHLPKKWPGNCALTRYLLRLLQQSDSFHLLKHYTRLRPDLFTPDALKAAQKRPWFLNIYRCVQIPLRTLRRKLLALLGFRNRSGKVDSEVFVEHGIRKSVPEEITVMAGKFQLSLRNHLQANGVEVISIIHHS